MQSNVQLSPMCIAPEDAPCLARHVRFVDGVDGGTILDISADRFYRLNRIGAWMLRDILNGRERALIVERLSTETQAPAAQIDTDLTLFLQDLRSKGLLQYRERGVTS